MKSDLLSLVLLDDRVGKISRLCPFCTRKYEWMSGFFGLWIGVISSAIWHKYVRSGCKQETRQNVGPFCLCLEEKS